MDEATKWTRVAAADALRPGEMMGLEVEGLELALYHLADGSWRASDNVCTHGAARLTDGWLEAAIVECPLHGGRFDLDTGGGVGSPIEQDLSVYPVRIVDGAVEVLLPTD
jgi:nitrite reductase/ring-hydroxylating ferredoxin subunit